MLSAHFDLLSAWMLHPHSAYGRPEPKPIGKKPLDDWLTILDDHFRSNGLDPTT